MKTSIIITGHFLRPQGKEKFIKQKTENATHLKQTGKIYY